MSSREVMKVNRSLLVALLAVLVVGLLAPGSWGFKYKPEYVTVDGRDYIYHRFTFNETDVEKMANSRNTSVGYARGVIETIWEMAEGPGSSVGQFVGRIYLGNTLYSWANSALENDEELGLLIKSETDEGKLWGLELLDNTADCWQGLAEGNPVDCWLALLGLE